MSMHPNAKSPYPLLEERKKEEFSACLSSTRKKAKIFSNEKRNRHHKATIFFFFLSNSKINRWRNSNNTEFKADKKSLRLWARKACCIRFTRYEALLLPRGWDEMNVELKFLNALHFYEHFNYSKVEKLTRLKETDQQHNEKKREEKREG